MRLVYMHAARYKQSLGLILEAAQITPSDFTQLDRNLLMFYFKELAPAGIECASKMDAKTKVV